MELLKVEVPHAPPPPTRRLDILFYSAPSSPRSSSSVLPDPTPPDSPDFEFDFSGHLDRPALSAADELFHAGKILPLKPPPAYNSSPKSPISKLRGAFSPKHKPNHDFDPFEAALDFTRRSDSSRRGRPKDPNPRRGISRSLSPLRVSEFALQQQQLQQQSNTSNSSRGYKKWKLKDLLLFRSASEGSRPNPKLDPLKKNSVGESSKRFFGGDANTSSFRSSIGEGSSRRRSAHEIHYAANRAVSEDLKKKTSLPFKFGLLGCLGFNLPSSSSSSSSGFQEFSRGFGYNLSR